MTIKREIGIGLNVERRPKQGGGWRNRGERKRNARKVRPKKEGETNTVV